MKESISSKHHYLFSGLLFFSFIKKRKTFQAQMMSEYATVILIIVSAVSAMIVFTKRTIQARAYDTQKMVMQEAGMGLGKGKALPMEYEPYYYESHTTTETDQVDRIKTTWDKQYKKELEINKITNTQGIQHAPSNE